MKQIRDSRGFILPLTVILSVIVVAAVLHAVFVLQSEQRFYRSAYQDFQLRQLRECAMQDIRVGLREHALPEDGRLSYDKGTVHFIVTAEQEERVKVIFTVVTDSASETDEMVLDASYHIIEWTERT
ncbi:MAG: ComGG family competence protein [Sporolactobacillus sp.]|jgi:hypothetical protein|nr:ComGG family competence protein [Sporolactobacillus sp.]